MIQTRLKPQYQEPVEAVTTALGTDARSGLSEAEAQPRLPRQTARAQYIARYGEDMPEIRGWQWGRSGAGKPGRVR